MKKIYSKIEDNKLLHIILRRDDIQEERMNIIDDDQFLQLAVMKLHKGKTFKPHKHLYGDKTTKITQESWVVIRGKVRALLYDLDGKKIAEPVLEEGDASITLYGGHTYEILADDTLVYEYKTGPYLGPEKDKEFI